MQKNIFHKFKNISTRGKRFWGVGILCLLLLIPIEFFIFSSQKANEDDLYWKSFLANNKIYGTIVPKNLSFAGEKVPLYDFTVIESMERELLVNTYFHSQTILMHKRANRCFRLLPPY